MVVGSDFAFPIGFRRRPYKLLLSLMVKTRKSVKSQVFRVTICAPSHNFVGLYLRNQGTYRQSEKNLLSSNVFPQYGEQRPTNGWDRSGSLGHPS